MSLLVGRLHTILDLDKKPFDDNLDKSEKSAKSWHSRVGGIFKKAGAEFLKWGAIGAGALAAGGFLAANYASDLNESMSKVGVVFKENAKDIQDWSKGAAQSMGMSRQKALEAAGTYGNLFDAMGIAPKTTADMSKGLVELAADLASFNNSDPAEVLEGLRSGLVGETEPLRQFGVNINQATIEAKAMAMGLWDGVGTIDAAAKAQASYSLILEQTTNAQGDFSRTSSGMANQQRIAAATFQDTMAQIGAAFTPIIEAILPAVSAGFAAFGTWITANMPTIKEVMGKVLGAIGAAFDWISQNILPALGAVFSWIVTDVLPPVIAIIDWISEHVIPPLVEAFTWVVSVVKANWPWIKTIVDAVAKGIQVAVGLIAKAFDVAIAAVRLLKSVFDGAISGIGDAFDGLRGVVARVWDGITAIGKGAVNGFIGLINGLIDAINSVQVHIPRVGIGPAAIGPFDWNGMKIKQLGYLAEGTLNWRGGMAMVGERGPEIVNVPRGAQVIPNDQLAGIGGGPLVGTMNNYGQTPDEVEMQLLRFQRRQKLEAAFG